MYYQTISEIYDANDKIRIKLKETVSNLSDEQANFLPDGAQWTIANIVEHLSMVEDGMTRISAKLLKEAQSRGEKADGKAKISEVFLQKALSSVDQKLQAPERVHPKANQTIAESLAKMDENRERLYDLRPMFETVECSEFKFPHPAFGDLTAHEWLALIGGHEARHLKQIKSMIEKFE